MNIKVAAFLGIIITILVVTYYLICEDWSWKKVILWIVGLNAVTTALLVIDNYRVFIIAIIFAILFEFKNLSQRK